MNRLKYLFAISFFLLVTCPYELTGQSISENTLGDNNLLKLHLIHTYELKESDYFISSILDIVHISDDSLLIITNTEDGVILYTDRGSVQKRISNLGRGPFEFVSPTISRVIDSKYFIWDSSQLKLSVFDKNGYGIREYSDFRWAINDFLVSGDYIYINNRGNSSGKILEKYQLSGSKRDPLFEAIDKTQEHLFLSSIQPSVRMTSIDDRILFISPSSLTLYALDTNSNEIKSIYLEDDDFHVPHIRSVSSLWSGAENPADYLRESSLVTNLFHVDGYIVIIARMGREIFNHAYNVYSSEERYFKILVLDSNLNLKDTFRYSLFENGMLFDGTWFSKGNRLGYVSRQNILNQPNGGNTIEPYTVHTFDIVSTSKN